MEHYGTVFYFIIAADNLKYLKMHHITNNYHEALCSCLSSINSL